MNMMSFLRMKKTAGIVTAMLLTMTASAQTGIVYMPGQEVTEFYQNDDYSIYTVPTLCTDEQIGDNWAYSYFADAGAISNEDQRAWRALFEVNAPAAGRYGVAMEVRSTTTNWQVGLSAAQSLEDWTWKEATSAPSWDSMTRATQQTVMGWDENGVMNFAGGEWETIVIPVELYEGHNFVTIWLCRAFQGWDALGGPDGSHNGFYVKSVKLLNEGAGQVADVLSEATQKLWQLKMFPMMATDATTTLATDYAQLLSDYMNTTDYSTLNTTAVQDDISNVAAAEQKLRHGEGLSVGSGITVLALPFYHDLQGGAVSENERGDFSDAPIVFEYTNGKTMVYKFTSTVDATLYPEVYAGSELSNPFHMSILAADSSTVVMNEWIQNASTGAWQTYQKFSKPSSCSFQVETGKTYFLTLYFENYVNVRGISFHEIVFGEKTYGELDELRVMAESYLVLYDKGTEGYYAIGCDDELLANLEEAIDKTLEFDEDTPVAEITDLYYQLEKLLSRFDNVEPVNMIPNTDENTFNLGRAEFDQWVFENNNNIGYGYESGSAVYSVYNRQDQKYDINLGFSNATGDESTLAVYVDVTTEEGSTIRVCNVEQQMAGTGDWGNVVAQTIQGLAIPQGMVTITFYGKKAATNGFVGNIYQLEFLPVEGTEGEGAKALDAAIAEYTSLYGVEKLQTLVESAKEAVAQYAFPEYDQTYVNRVLPLIINAEQMVADGNLNQRAAAYQALKTAMDELPNSMLIVWLPIPSSDNNPFSFEAGSIDKWEIMEDENKIGMVVGGGSAVYYAEVEEAGIYEMAIETANMGEGGQFRVIVTPVDSETPVFDGLMDVPDTGDWSARDFIKTTMNLPQGRVKVVIYGETAATSGFVGDIYSIRFETGDVDGLSTVSMSTAETPMTVYDLTGRKHSTQMLKRGLYISNGKKLLVK